MLKVVDGYTVSWIIFVSITQAELQDRGKVANHADVVINACLGTPDADQCTGHSASMSSACVRVNRTLQNIYVYAKASDTR